MLKQSNVAVSSGQIGIRAASVHILTESKLELSCAETNQVSGPPGSTSHHSPQFGQTCVGNLLWVEGALMEDSNVSFGKVG